MKYPCKGSLSQIKFSKNSLVMYTVFIGTLVIVMLSVISLVFPAMIISLLNPDEVELNPLEAGPYWLAVILIDGFLIGIGLAYYKNCLPVNFSNQIKKIQTFEISKKITFFSIIVILAIYVILSVGELQINEETQWTDYEVLKRALEDWPYTDSEEVYVKEQSERYVRMFLLFASQDFLGNIKILPFVASILLVILTYFFTYQISGKRISGVVSMVILLQSYTFLKYDTIAVYENFWVLFYLFSIYAIYKKWYFSAIGYLLSVFTKAFAAPFILMNVFFVFRSKISKKTKLLTLISYGISIGIILSTLLLVESVYGNVIRIDFDEFLIGFTSWSYQLRFDYVVSFTLLPLTIGLFLKSKNGLKDADSILVLIAGTILIGPILALITDFYFILPYRFVPHIVFVAVGIGLMFSKKPS